MTPPRRSGGDGGGRKAPGGKAPGGKSTGGKTRGKPGDGRPGTVAPARGRGAPTGASPTNRDFAAARVEARRGAARTGAKKTGTSAPAAAGKAGSTTKARDEGPMRVQRALARVGVVSRRGADQAVADGRVQVNGTVAQIGQVVDPRRDVITLDGVRVETHVTEHRWIVLNKPAAVMTTRRDPQARTTVFDLVEDVPGLVYVGRLDFMTEGVLLLTTDGTAAHALTHPSREVERTYVATVRGDASTAAREARDGVQLEDGLVVPRDVQAYPLGSRRWAVESTGS
ncbi:MAG: pseudouridine synthase, partial [Gemmatimonas sp.]